MPPNSIEPLLPTLEDPGPGAPGRAALGEVSSARFPALLREEASDQRRLEQDLRLAVTRQALHIHYQPRVLLRAGRTVGAEALLRWRHPRRGTVSPATFIPMAERTGLITELGGWTMAAACTEAAGWPGDVAVSVNVSAAQLAEAALLPQVTSALARSGLPARRLELELTESMLVDASVENLLTLSALRDMGVSLALDDFGTGYASLASLKRLPLTALKLDRSLLLGLPGEVEDRVIVRSLVEIGHAMGLKIVAEGVETVAQRDFLLEAGCDEGQAYLFGRPMCGAALRGHLMNMSGAAVSAPHGSDDDR